MGDRTAAGRATRIPATRALIVGALLLAAVSGCAREATSRRELTQRQRDSTLGRSVIPGAGTVTRALNVSDEASRAAAARNAEIEEQPR